MRTNKTVLHVDDDQAILNLVRVSLQKRGYTVISVIDPLIALAILNKSGARVAILDIEMPGMDGLALLREIKQRDAGIKTIMLTGMVSMGTILQATRLGAEECVFKPIKDLNYLSDAVDRCFQNIDSWWDALREWIGRNNEEKHVQSLVKNKSLNVVEKR
jgi:DNA-binding NtrC family response regulator